MSTADIPEVKSVLRPVTRWTFTKKYWLVIAVKRKVISLEAACALHGISSEEFDRWTQLEKHRGAEALKTTRVQRYRT